MLAGRALFGTWSITIHGVVGNVTFSIAMLLAALAVLLKRGGLIKDKVPVVMAIALTVILTMQIGLGYVGRDSAEAAAWHVPLGVLSFGLAIYQTNLVVKSKQLLYW